MMPFLLHLGTAYASQASMMHAGVDSLAMQSLMALPENSSNTDPFWALLFAGQGGLSHGAPFARTKWHLAHT